MLSQYFDGVVPAGDGDFGLRRAMQETLPRVEAAYESLEFSRALEAVWEVITLANRVIEEQKPWAKIKAGERDSVAALLRELLAVCQWCAIVLNPVMPYTARGLLERLALKPEPEWKLACDTQLLLTPGHRCAAPQPLFPRIKNLEEVIKAMSTQFQSTETQPVESQGNIAPAPGEQGSTPAPQADTPAVISAPAAQEEKAVTTIDYEDFAKVELRAGRVLEAERVPKADKLLRLQVDLGSEQRQILAGIAQQFEPESLVGKTVVVVANLAPRKLRGFESQGMILAASTPDGPPLGLVTVDADVEPGSFVK
jgi:methionyl-tRNA synthetase